MFEVIGHLLKILILLDCQWLPYCPEFAQPHTEMSLKMTCNRL